MQNAGVLRTTPHIALNRTVLLSLVFPQLHGIFPTPPKGGINHTYDMRLSGAEKHPFGTIRDVSPLSLPLFQ